MKEYFSLDHDETKRIDFEREFISIAKTVMRLECLINRAFVTEEEVSIRVQWIGRWRSITILHYQFE